MVLSTLTGTCSVYTPTAPTATDNFEGSITGTTTTIFPITEQGNYSITWTYEDVSGNSSTQTQNIIIEDITAPIADESNLPDITRECLALVTYTPTASDNCSYTIT
ncbi:MAG: hypothetical protein L3J05_03120, partial [Robiginitomaculum sp.]|nr:hypothetical protein [Robiginitomaculum sp.]